MYHLGNICSFTTVCCLLIVSLQKNFWDTVSNSSGWWSQTLCAVQDDLDVRFSPLLLWSWDYRCLLPCQVYVRLEIKLGDPCILEKHSIQVQRNAENKIEFRNEEKREGMRGGKDPSSHCWCSPIFHSSPCSSSGVSKLLWQGEMKYKREMRNSERVCSLRHILPI